VQPVCIADEEARDLDAKRRGDRLGEARKNKSPGTVDGEERGASLDISGGGRDGRSWPRLAGDRAGDEEVAGVRVEAGVCEVSDRSTDPVG
jgi:hypothetical protein